MRVKSSNTNEVLCISDKGSLQVLWIDDWLDVLLYTDANVMTNHWAPVSF